MPFAAALSEHPETAVAVGEVVGRVLDTLGPAPDVVVLGTSGAHNDAFDDVVAAVHTLLEPGALIGCTASGVIGGRREVESHDAVMLWAARGPQASAFHARVDMDGDGFAIGGLPHDLAPGTTLVMLGEPVDASVDLLADLVAEVAPHLVVVAGSASRLGPPGNDRVAVDGKVHRIGAAVLALPPQPGVRTLVSTGARPVGDPYTVTSVDGRWLETLGGRPTHDRLEEEGRKRWLGPMRGNGPTLQVGVVLDDRDLDTHHIQFSVVPVRNAGRPGTGIELERPVEVGATVHVVVIDADAAEADLVALLDGTGVEGVLALADHTRGIRLYGEPDQDATVIARTISRDAIAGWFCGGVAGPDGARSRPLEQAAVLVAFTDP